MILNYVPQFRGKTFIICIDGGVIQSPNFSNILTDLAALHSIGVRMVLVFGATVPVQVLAQERGETISDQDELSPTDETTLKVAIDAIGRLTNDLKERLSSVGIRATEPNVLTVHRAGILNGQDLLFTGRVDSICVQGLQAQLEEDGLPIISPLGYTRGQTVRLHSAETAALIARELRAAKLIHLLESPLHSPRELSVGKAESDLLGKVSPRHDSKLRHSIQACRNGVPRAHFVDGQQRKVSWQSFSAAKELAP